MRQNLIIITCVVTLLYNSYRYAEARAVGSNVNFIEDIELSYDNGVWHCDKLICPEETVGCRILRKNNPSKRTQLLRKNNCYNAHNETTASEDWSEDFIKGRAIAIDIDSHLGATTQAKSGYSLTGQQVKGVIAVEDWINIQELMREIITEVEGPRWQFDEFVKST